MRVVQYGWDSLLLEVDDPVAWSQALREANLPCEEIVPGARTVLIRGYTGEIDLAPTQSVLAPQRTVTIPVVWDGPDLFDDGAQVMRDTTFTVAFCGFLPGFAYLTGLPSHLHLPRLATPRTRVPAGSVAIAGPYAGIYPRSSPGGWHLLGTTSVTLFDLAQDPPALLRPGTTVRFVDA